MTVRKLSRSLWSLLITLTLAFAGVSFTGAANAIPGETGDIYRAYAEDSPSTENTNIYVHPDGDDSNPIVGYCFNIHKQWPTESKSYMANKTFYLHKDVSGVASFTDTPRKIGPSGERLSPESFDQAVSKVILNGYPNNSDLQRKYELSDDEYRMITQDAFHYYSDNVNASRRISQNNTYMKVFDILVGKAEDNATKPVPENAVINVLEYDPNGKSNFQNLITVDFRPAPVDEPTTADVTFSKVAAGQGEELPGATLTVTGGDNFSETWVSTGTAKQLTLAPGEYTMTEKAAPEGYLIANDINFRITENGTLEIKGSDGQYASAENSTVQMIDELAPVDEPTTADVTFSKVAAGQGEELPGATLTVTGGDNFSETWVSTGTAKQLTLAPGEYTMTEKAAPEGYLIANDINFRITENGTLEIKGSDGQYASAENSTVQMIDELAPVDTPAEPRDTTPGSEARGPQTPATREQVTSLPRTGSMTGMLAMLSFALVAVGSLLTLRRKDV